MNILIILIIISLLGYFITCFFETRKIKKIINSLETLLAFKPEKELWKNVFIKIQKIGHIHMCYLFTGLFLTIHSLILGEGYNYMLNFSLLIFLGSYIIIGISKIGIHTLKDYDLELKLSFLLLGVLLGFSINLSFFLSDSLFSLLMFFLLIFPVNLFLWINFTPTRWNDPPYYIFTKEGIRILSFNSIFNGFWYYDDLLSAYKLSNNWLIIIEEKDLKALDIIFCDKNFLNIQKILAIHNIPIREVSFEELKNRLYYFNF